MEDLKEEELTLLWTFGSDIKAEQARILLEEHGFFVHLNNSFSSRLNEGVAMMTNISVNGVRLYTKKSQAYDAYVLLAMKDLVPMKDITPGPSGIDAFQNFMRKIPGLKSVSLIGHLFIAAVVIALIVVCLLYQIA